METKELNQAPKVDEENVNKIVGSCEAHFWIVPGTTTTIAVLVNPAGFVLGIGFSNCVSKENFDPVAGEMYALKDAEDKARAAVWSGEGYVLARALGKI